MMHPLLVLLAAATTFFAPMLKSAIQTKQDAVETARSVETRSMLFEAAQILASHGTYELATNTILLPMPGTDDALPAALPAPLSDAWSTGLAYCTGASQSLPDVALALVSAGPDRVRTTSCYAALNGTSSGDDILVRMTHADAATWAGRTESRLTLVNQAEELDCDAPLVVAYDNGAWECTNVDDLISAELDGSTADCAVANGTGEKTWDGAAKAWGSCIVVECDPGYVEHNNACIPEVIPCTVDNGSGTATWNGTEYGQCVATSCDEGYRVENGQCVEALVVGTCYRITCTSRRGRTRTLIGNAADANVVHARAPSGLGTWVVGVTGDSAGGFRLNFSYNCMFNHAAGGNAQFSNNSSCQRYGPLNSGESGLFTAGYGAYFASCQVPTPC
ncbi:MAG: hypothetical protein RLO06_18465 [Parvibaculum sp.]